MIEYVLGMFWGIFIGFAIAVPVGPVGLIVVQRTIAKGRVAGLVSGLGAAVADGLLASIGAFSITVIYIFIKHHQALLQVFGGGILLVLGLLALYGKQKKEGVEKENTVTLIEEGISAFLLTITNPLSAFSFFLAFAGISHKIGSGPAVAVTFVIGVFIGSCLWWFFLTYIADKIAHRITPEKIKTLNKYFSAIIVCVGVIIMLGVLFKSF